MNLRKTPLPIVLLAIGLLSFGIALIEALIVHAESFQDLSFIGKTFTVIAVTCLAIAFVRYFLVPVYFWIKRLKK